MNMRQLLLAGSTVIGLSMSPTLVLADDLRIHNTSGLTGADCDAIIAAAKGYAAGQDGAFRAGTTPPKNHYACVNRMGQIVRFVSDGDAWEGSRDVAKAKAYTAMAFSSDENALTTRTIFCATQPGGPLWQIGNSNQAGMPKGPGSINQLGIIQFPGGVPIYIGAKLVGGFGVSGDSIQLDELTALAGTLNYAAPDRITSKTVLGVSYRMGDGGACPVSGL